ncbi:MAG: PstS family phosphate ABC transporter substrate-binding protein [Elusimicrobiota bacterium]|nr:PstS family phosphate ABC transporter substrate-binding protein [Elusimicrobiota bacterium]
MNLVTRAVAAVLTLALSGVPAAAASLIKVDGSSTVFPLTEAVAEEFQKEQKGAVQVTVGISGTGGGFKKFCRGETDLQDASRPILKQEMEACAKAGVKYYELPVAFDALTVAVNPKNDWAKSITVAELKKMWEPAAQGTVTKWSEVRKGWPDRPFKLFGAGSDSGTFDYFTEAVNGKSKASRGDFTASEDDNTLVTGISNDRDALGYIPYAYFEPNKDKMKALAVDNGKGGVLPSLETVKKGTYAPLSRPLFVYVSAASVSKPEVKAFVEFYLKKVGALALEVKYLPLTDKAYALALERFAKGRLGTGFGGTPDVAVRVEDLLKRQPKL